MKKFRDLIKETYLAEKNTIFDGTATELDRIKNKIQTIALSVDSKLGKKLEDKFNEVKSVLNEISKLQVKKSGF